MLRTFLASHLGIARKPFLAAAMGLIAAQVVACSSLPSAPATATATVSASPAATRVPATSSATTKPLGEHVVVEWKVNSPADIYLSSDSVWVPGHGDGNVTQIDPSSNEVTAVVSRSEAEKPPEAEGFGSVWMTTRDNKLNRVDPATSEILASIVLADGYPDINNGVMVGSSAVWALQQDNAELIRVDPATNSIVSKTSWGTLIDQATAATSVPTGKGTDFMWIQVVGDEGEGFTKGLLRLDPDSGAGLTFLPYSPDQNGDGRPSITDDAVWYAAGGHIYRINVATNQIDATYATEPGIIHLAIGFGSVWVANYGESLVQRLDVAL
jgi:hypothetical protein